jgi:hypothetical protein
LPHGLSFYSPPIVGFHFNISASVALRPETKATKVEGKQTKWNKIKASGTKATKMKRKQRKRNESKESGNKSKKVKLQQRN